MPQVSDIELHDFVDGRLDPERRQVVAAAIDQDPLLEAKVRSYQAQMKGLHELYDPVVDEPVPDHLARITREAGAPPSVPRGRLAWAAQAAVLAVVFILGGGGGWFLHERLASGPALLAPVVKQAVLAHQILESAARRDNALLGPGFDIVSQGQVPNPFDVPLRAPVTAGVSQFTPVSHRGAVGAIGPTAQILYRDEEGAQVSLYVQAHSQGSGVPFETALVDGYDILYWIDGPLVYVLIGEEGGTTLLDLAESFYTAPTIRPAAAPAGAASPP